MRISSKHITPNTSHATAENESLKAESLKAWIANLPVAKFRVPVDDTASRPGDYPMVDYALGEEIIQTFLRNKDIMGKEIYMCLFAKIKEAEEIYHTEKWQGMKAVDQQAFKYNMNNYLEHHLPKAHKLTIRLRYLFKDFNGKSYDFKRFIDMLKPYEVQRKRKIYSLSSGGIFGPASSKPERSALRPIPFDLGSVLDPFNDPFNDGAHVVTKRR